MRATAHLRRLALALGSLCALVPGLAHATGCADYTAAIQWMGGTGGVGTARDVAVLGSLACVAAGDHVVVVDVANPRHPFTRGSTPVPGYARGVAMVGNYAFVASELAGLRVIDLSNPDAPSVTGTLITAGRAYEIAIAGNLAYLAIGDAGLAIIDISTPTAPVLVGTFQSYGRARAVAIAGNYAYLAERAELAGNPPFGLLEVVDVTDPAAPTFAGFEVTPAEVIAVALAPGLAYLAGGDSHGLDVIDIASPTAPVKIGHLGTASGTSDVLATGNRVFLMNGNSYPAGQGVQVIDVTHPATPVSLGFAGTPSVGDGLALVGNMLYAVGWEDPGFQVIDVSRPEVVTVTLSTDSPSPTRGIAVQDGLAYVGSGEFFVSELMILDPTFPQPLLGSVTAFGMAHDVEVVGNRAYVATGSNSDSGQQSGLQIVNVSNPAAPQTVGWLQRSLTEVLGLDVSGSYAYLATGDLIDNHTSSGLDIVRIDTAQPQPMGRIELPPDAFDVAVAGTHAFVTARQNGLLVVDVADPASPQLVTQLPILGEARTIEILGEYACIAAGITGLVVVDISDPEAPSFVSNVPTPEPAMGVALSGPVAYVSNGGLYSGATVVVVDLSNPASPIMRGIADTHGVAGRLAAGEEFVGVATLTYGGNAVDFLPLQCPVTTAVSPASSPPAVKLLAVAPNPASLGAAAIQLRFELARAMRTHVTVFDAAGRLVRRLIDESLTSGAHTAAWDGRNDAGRLSAPGVYFYHLATESGFSGSQKVVVLR